MLSLPAKCHRDTTLAIKPLKKATKSLPGIVPQQLPTLAVTSRSELPAGYKGVSYINASELLHSHSVFFGNGTVSHVE